MLKTYTWPRYAYKRAMEVGAGVTSRVPLVIVGVYLVATSRARRARVEATAGTASSA